MKINIKFRKASTNTGFTLIEVMVALMIFAVVSVLAAQGLKVLIRSHQAVREQSDRLEELQIALTIIDRNITQSMDRGIINEQNVTQSAFLGTQTSIEFTHGGYTNPQGTVLRSTLQRTAYLLKNGDLVQRDWPVLDRTAKTLPNDRILIKHVTALRFRYIGLNNQYFISWPPDFSTVDNTNKALNSQQESSLPRAVEMTMTIAHWGELSRVFIIPGQPTISES